ncbi:MAG: hypothetical protein K5657_00895 [Desulfovibrio sp.]|nr:hypothetical protein [Desulfovibrio sp.]
MKFFKSISLTFLSNSLSRPYLFLFCVVLAFSMWYFVCQYETSEKEVQLLLNYKGQPKELYVTDGLVYSVRERIRGPKPLLDKFPNSYPVPIDISGLKVGEGYTNNFSVVDEQKKYVSEIQLRAFSIIDIDHPIIRLHAEYRDRVSIPLSFRYRSDNDLIVVTHKVSQSSVACYGPENEIRGMKSMTTLPLDIRVDLLDVGRGIVQKDIPVIISQTDYPHVTIDPSSITVFYEVKGERVEVVRPFDVKLSVTNPTLYSVSPSQINLRLKVPANKRRDLQYLKELRVTALPPDMQEGESKRVKVSFTPPEGMEVMGTEIFVTVKRLTEEERMDSEMKGDWSRSSEKELLREKNVEQEKAKRRAKRRGSAKKDGQTSQKKDPGVKQKESKKKGEKADRAKEQRKTRNAGSAGKAGSGESRKKKESGK